MRHDAPCALPCQRDRPCPHDLLWQRGPPCRDQRAWPEPSLALGRNRAPAAQARAQVQHEPLRLPDPAGPKSETAADRSPPAGRRWSGCPHCPSSGRWQESSGAGDAVARSAAPAEPRSGVLHPGLDAQRRATSTAPRAADWSAATPAVLAPSPAMPSRCPRIRCRVSEVRRRAGRSRHAARPGSTIPALAERDWASRHPAGRTALTRRGRRASPPALGR